MSVEHEALVEADPTATQRIARFVAELAYENLSSAVRDKAKLHLLDTVGCELAFARLPASAAVHRYAESFPAAAGDSATIANFGTTTNTEVAALVNATFAHGFELDDTEMSSVSHPGAVVVPAALAVAEAIGATGEDLITAIVAGYEAMVRVGRAGTKMERRGFHATPIVGPFGAAAAATSLLHLDAATTAHAFGIAASRASGIAEYASTGGSVKRLHAGFAAQSGIQAARLAAFGMTAPAAALEGERGLIAAITDAGDPGSLSRPVEPAAILDTGFKLHACCAAQHTVIDAMARLIAAHPGLRPDTVERIHVRQNKREADVVGVTAEPRDVVSAQFSAAFALALRLVRGSNGVADYTAENLNDPELLAISRRVTYEAQSADDPLEGFGPCALTVTLSDGEVLHEQVAFARGTARDPLARADIEAKFFALTGDVLGGRVARELADLVHRSEELADAGDLARVLVATTAEGSRG